MTAKKRRRNECPCDLVKRLQARVTELGKERNFGNADRRKLRRDLKTVKQALHAERHLDSLFRCPECGGPATLLDKGGRYGGKAVTRHRACDDDGCGHTFCTHERVVKMGFSTTKRKSNA